MKKHNVNDSFKEFFTALPLLEGLPTQDMEALLRVAHTVTTRKANIFPGKEKKSTG